MCIPEIATLESIESYIRGCISNGTRTTEMALSFREGALLLDEIDKLKVENENLKIEVEETRRVNNQFMSRGVKPLGGHEWSAENIKRELEE